MLKQKFKTLSLRLLIAIVAIMALPDIARADFYLLGNTDGGGSWSQTDSNKFTYDQAIDNGDQYILEVENLASEFKIFNTSNNQWTGNSGGGKISLDATDDYYTANQGSGDNIQLNNGPFGKVKIYLKVWNNNGGSLGIYIQSVKTTPDETTPSTDYSGLEYKDCEFTVFFDNSASNWGTPTAWVWTEGGANYTVKGSWAGDAMTNEGNGIYSWTYTGNLTTAPESIIFSNNGSSQTGTLSFVNGGVYTSSGLVGNATAVSCKELTGVTLSGLDGVDYGDATVSGNVYTWSFTYSGETKTVSVAATETYDDNTTESSDAVETTLYNGSDYLITYDISTNNLSIVPTHYLTDVTCNIGTLSSNYVWTYAHTTATETKAVEIVATWTNEQKTYSEEKEFKQGSFYTITYDPETNTVSYDEVAETVSAPTIAIDNTTVTNGTMTEEDGVYTYKYTLNTTSGEVLYFNFKRVYTNSEIDGYERVEYIVPSGTQTTDANGVGYTVSADGSNKFNATFSPGVETTIALESALVKVYEKAPVEITLYGLADNNWETNNAGYTMTDGNKDGIYEYQFIFTGSQKYFHFKASDGTTTEYYTPLSNTDDTKKLITTSPLSYAVHSSNPNISFHYDFLVNEEYRIVLDTNNQTAYVQFVSKGNATSGANSVKIAGNSKYGLTDISHTSTSGAIDMTYAGNNVYTWSYDYTQENATTDLLWVEFVIDNNYYGTEGDSSVSMEEGQVYTIYNRSEGGQYQTHNFSYLPEYSSVTVYVNPVTEQVWITRTIDTSYKSGIPVYPLGVSSETELAAYDFTTNHVYYLCSPVLNANRISPEWQMVAEADGKYYIRNFTMRDTKARNKTATLEEGNIKVVQFTSMEQEEGTEKVSTTYNKTGDENPWSEGRLYNACYDPESNTLTLTAVEAAAGRMPFMSMVGYNFQQLEENITPRGESTSRGWQESWILYDENGNVVKNRNGKVLYSTMWPPKNPVYFNAVKGTESIELSSKNLTFSNTDGYLEKTGSVWQTELQSKDSEAYAGLDSELGADTKYIRYTIDNMWILGATKIWTGWGGQIADWGSNWDNHINWGYGSNFANDGGEEIQSQNDYTMSQNAGNFLVETPTYYRTVEFFYNVSDPTQSVFYTTLAFGNPSIRAKATEDYHGNYDIEVADAGSNHITAYTVTRYNAVTGEIDTANGDNGVVKSETRDWTADTFNTLNETDGWVKEKELANGKYYYVLDITIGEKKVTVQSNPFTIYRPETHQSEVKAVQLLQLTGTDTAAGTVYYTVPTTVEGGLDETVAIKQVTVANDGTVSVADIVDQTSALAKIKSNDGYNWTMKVLLTSEVPASWTEEMADTDATTMQDGKVINYNLFINGDDVVDVTPASDSNMYYVYDHGTISANQYAVTMDYSYTLSGVAGVKSTVSKNTTLQLTAPKALGVEAVSAVSSDSEAQIGEETDVITATLMASDKSTKEIALNSASAQAHHYSVDFKFTQPNITADLFAQYAIVYVPTLTITDKDGNVSTVRMSRVKDTNYSNTAETITITDIDPTVQSVAMDITTQYCNSTDNSFLSEGNFGEWKTLTSTTAWEFNQVVSGMSGKMWYSWHVEQKTDAEGVVKDSDGNIVNEVNHYDVGFNVESLTISESVSDALNGEYLPKPTCFDYELSFTSADIEDKGLLSGENDKLFGGTKVTFEDVDTENGNGTLATVPSNITEPTSGKYEVKAPTVAPDLTVYPVYIFNVDAEGTCTLGTGLETVTENTETASYLAATRADYVGVYGNVYTFASAGNMMTSIDGAAADNVVVKAGRGFIEVIGAEEATVYSVSGAIVGAGANRYEVAPGVYVVLANGKVAKVVVR